MKVFITTGNGYAPEPLEYSDPHQAWSYISELFHAVCKAENPDVMPIIINFVKEKEVEEDDIIQS